MNVDKKVLVLIVFIVSIILVGCFLIFYIETGYYEGIYAVPVSTFGPVWDDENKEISIGGSFATVNGENYDNVLVEVTFYKEEPQNGIIDDTKIIGTKKLYCLKMEDGILNINFTTKLPENPAYFNIKISNMDNRLNY